MTEFKTLKDLKDWEHPIYNEECTEVIGIDYDISKSELKKEAIKWVKEDRDDLILIYGVHSYKSVSAYQQLKKWMKRLNITEEDLK